MTDILIVDDLADNRDLLAMHCNLGGLTCHGCSSGGEALEWLAEHRPKIVLLDIAMPVLTGLDVADGIRKNETARNIDPTIIAFYTGAGNISTSVKANMIHNNVRKIFIKGSVDLYEMVAEMKSWIQE